MEDKERELIFEVAGMAGDILLRSGAEISRVDETMRRIACAYELENVSTFVLSNGICLLYTSPEARCWLSDFPDPSHA